jgi:chondroitin 4-sulfotransferase 11
MPPSKLAFILEHRNASSDENCGSPRRQVGFVGIGKTGSLFMQSALELFAHDELLPTVHREPTSRPCAVGARMGWHHASAKLWHRAFSVAWSSAFTFSIVRDPWARLVSHWAFHIVSKSPLDSGHLTPAERSAAKANESHSIALFRSWVQHARKVHPPGASDAWRFTTADAHGNEQVRGFNASQLSWLVDEHGTMLVNEVYKLEELEARWPELQTKVCGLRRHSYADTRNNPVIREMDHPSRHAPFADYYDDATSRIVAEYMAPDIRRFGYVAPRTAP